VRELNIDWAALHSAFQMNMPEVRCFLAVEDGRVLKLPPGDPSLATVRGDPQRYMAIDAIPSRIQYQWLDEFIKAIEDEPVRERMEAAINGKGAFRRFKDILLTLPDERRRWFEYRDQMMRQRIVDWVREQGIVPLNEAPWAIDGQLGPNSSALGIIPSSDTHAGLSPMGPPVSKPAPAALNSQHEIEALRDFLIEWSDGRQAEVVPGPLELEELATQIAKHFRVRPVHP
jgi:hypothetical protein